VRTVVYIDGFNLYYRRPKPSPQFKWLNLKALCDSILAAPMVVERVNYYTTRVSGKLTPGGPARQKAYLDALATIPEISIHYGNFLFSQKWTALVEPPQAKPTSYAWPAALPDPVLIEKAEEKGSDVNLACHLVRDALTNAFDVAVVLTNDTDLIEPIRIVRAEAATKVVGLLTPKGPPAKRQRGKWMGAHSKLTSAVDWTLHIHDAALRAAQFPSPIPGTSIHRPASWV
jgi:hypothetical protein